MTDGLTELSWSALSGATGYDVVSGSLATLLATSGDFQHATARCLANDLSQIGIQDLDAPLQGDGFWYLVRGVNCAGHASFDSSAPSQTGSRDAGVADSQAACP